MDKLLTVSEVAKLLRVSNMTVYRMLKGGSLPAIKVGRSYRISDKQLDKYISSNSFRLVELDSR